MGKGRPFFASKAMLFAFFCRLFVSCVDFFYFCRLIETDLVQYLMCQREKIEVMRKIARHLMTALLIMVAAPFVKAQVHVGDILCEGNVVVSPSSFAVSGHTPIGVVFHVDGSRQHGWAVGLKDLGKYQWGPNSVDTPLRNRMNKLQAKNDLDGYNNTKTILEGGYDIPFPAFDFLDFENGWYLPALGQLKYLYANLDKVNESLSAVDGTPFSTEEDWEFWSSTEYSICNAWSMDSSGKFYHKDESYNGNKDDRKIIRGVRNF